MKKTFVLAFLAASVAIISISCSKSGGLVSGSSSTNGNGSGSNGGSPTPPPSSPSSNVPVLTGSWTSIALFGVSASGMNFLTGTYWFGNPIPNIYSDAERFVYARSISGLSYTYIPVPNIDGRLYIQKDMTDRKLDIIIHYETYYPMPNASNFSNYEYRYVVVPRSMYQSTQVDWTDYVAVATTLNFPL